MTQQPSTPGLNLRGAVDLSSLSQPAGATPGAPGAGAGGAPTSAAVVDVTVETLESLVQRSTSVPVVVVLHSARSQASGQLLATMQELADSYRGRFLLGRADVDASPQLAQVFQVQAVPSTVAVLGGQPMPLFQGSPTSEQIRGVLDQVLEAAAQNGITGTVDVGEPEGEEPAEPEEPPLPAHLQAAYDLIDAGDLDGAAAGLEQHMRENPGDAEARAGLAPVALLRRLEGLDPAATLAAATAAAPGDVDAQLPAADVELSTGQAAAAYARLIAVVRVTAGDDRERARERLVELFLLAAPDDADVLKARRDLSFALY
jgi:putative thioredoxin